jgi:predicted amidohydrolase
MDTIMVVRIALAQVTPVWEDPGATLRRVEPLVAKAAADGASIICFPEQFTTGWDPVAVSNKQPINGEIFQTLSRYAKRYDIAVLGSLRLLEGGKLFNACIVAGRDGKLLATYRKVHLFSPLHEGTCYHPGENIATFQLGGMTFGIAICYDLRFAPLFRVYATAGAECVLVPSAWPASRMDAWELFVRTRAIENQVFVAGINTAGITPVDRYTGNSMVAGPLGNIIRRAPDNEGITCADLDPGAIRQANQAMRIEEDRQTGLYHDMARATKKK